MAVRKESDWCIIAVVNGVVGGRTTCNGVASKTPKLVGWLELHKIIDG